MKKIALLVAVILVLFSKSVFAEMAEDSDSAMFNNWIESENSLKDSFESTRPKDLSDQLMKILEHASNQKAIKNNRVEISTVGGLKEKTQIIKINALSLKNETLLEIIEVASKSDEVQIGALLIFDKLAYKLNSDHIFEEVFSEEVNNLIKVNKTEKCKMKLYTIGASTIVGLIVIAQVAIPVLILIWIF
ncbi:hypothetical protein J4403_02615 [Candidatus Woesearchaeota archaeon]|nr:hypothetical protein [Candidatus Woesearchaeota archaeon]